MTKSSKSLLLWLLVSAAVILVVLVIVFGGGSGTNGGNSSLDGNISADDWTKGNPDATITLVEYSDFQCPACGSFQPIVKDIVSEFSNHIKFVYRHFPLGQHANAQLAGQAAEAAGVQGKFFEMHDMIFENQVNWSNQSNSEAEKTFISYAEQLELNVDEFTDYMNSNKAKNDVESDYDSGLRAGVNSTPSFYLNGEKINNPRSLDDFRTLIREAIEAST